MIAYACGDLRKTSKSKASVRNHLYRRVFNLLRFNDDVMVMEYHLSDSQQLITNLVDYSLDLILYTEAMA